MKVPQSRMLFDGYSINRYGVNLAAYTNRKRQVRVLTGTAAMATEATVPATLLAALSAAD